MKYIALLRGINVGGNHKVDMKILKKVFENLGYTDVKTYINSGNVIFTDNRKNNDAGAESIETNIKETFGFPIPTLLISEKDLRNVMQNIPENWENNAEQRTDVLFLWEKFRHPSTLEKIKIHPEVDILIYSHAAIIWHMERKDHAKSKMRDFIGTDIYKHMTARNINTVRKLLSLLSS